LPIQWLVAGRNNKSRSGFEIFNRFQGAVDAKFNPEEYTQYFEVLNFASNVEIETEGFV